MFPESDDKVEFLKQVVLFNEFTEDELAQVAERLNSEYVGAGEVIFSQNDERDNLYIIYNGEVRITRVDKDGSKKFLASLNSWDIFGEDALLSERNRSATAKAVEDTDLFYLTESDLNWVRGKFPKIETYLIAFSRSHETVRKLKIRWLNEDETISLVARRHPISMIIELLFIAFLVSVTVTLTTVFITFLSDARVITLLSVGTAGLITFIGLIAGIWSYFEWRNDYFFVTNLRVVWRERILFRSTSRQEVPLRRIQSLDVQTPNVFARLILVGDLIIRTFNSQMRLTDVHHPDRMKDMIDAFLQKAQRRSVQAEHESIKRVIRSRLGHQEEAQPHEPIEAPLDVQGEKQRISLFKTRMVENDIITYRKHWWIFFKGAWQPTLALFTAVFLSITFTVTVFNLLRLIGLLTLYFIPFIIFLWWLYEYEDWRNDIYRVTKDRIIDRDKKPFGKESFRSAPIKNIQSVGHEVPNTIGLILNVGNVRINVGEEIFTFDGVHDPALVHQDISRRMEELAVQTERDRIQQEHERMATWLEIYHGETKGEIDAGPLEHIPDFD
jgi:CRP-like cAMP-binding protein